jgi:hypothetical protein
MAHTSRLVEVGYFYTNSAVVDVISIINAQTQQLKPATNDGMTLHKAKVNNFVICSILQVSCRLSRVAKILLTKFT